MQRPRRSRCALVLAGALFLSACSGDVQFSFGGEAADEAAVKLIEGDAMAQRLMVDPITDAICDEPATNDVGEVFACTGQTPTGTIDFEVTIEEDDRIFAAPQNVVAANFLPDYVASAIEALNNENDLTLPPGSLDCGTESIVLDAQMQMVCTLNDPETGQTFDAVMTIRDVNLGTFAIEIAAAAG